MKMIECDCGSPTYCLHKGQRVLVSRYLQCELACVLELDEIVFLVSVSFRRKDTRAIYRSRMNSLVYAQIFISSKVNSLGSMQIQ